MELGIYVNVCRRPGRWSFKLVRLAPEAKVSRIHLVISVFWGNFVDVGIIFACRGKVGLNSPFQNWPLFWPHTLADWVPIESWNLQDLACYSFIFSSRHFPQWLNLIESLSGTDLGKVSDLRLWVAGADSPNHVCLFGADLTQRDLQIIGELGFLDRITSSAR